MTAGLQRRKTLSTTLILHYHEATDDSREQLHFPDNSGRLEESVAAEVAGGTGRIGYLHRYRYGDLAGCHGRGRKLSRTTTDQRAGRNEHYCPDQNTQLDE